MYKLIIATFIGILSLETSFATQSEMFTPKSSENSGGSLDEMADSLTSGSDLMLIPLNKKSDRCVKTTATTSLTQDLIKHSGTALNAKAFVRSARKDLERFSPDFIVIKYKGKDQLTQSKKELPVASQELINILAQEIQKKLDDESIDTSTKKQLISSLEKDLERLKKTGEFDAQSYPALWQIFGESLIRNVFFFSTEYVAQFVPIINSFSLLSFNMDLKLNLANSLDYSKPLSIMGTKEISAMALTSGCQLIPSVSHKLAPMPSPYEQIRSDVVSSHMPGGHISPHGHNYSTLDKTIIPAILPSVCGSLTYAVASLMCDSGNTVLDQPMVLVGAFLTKTAVETTIAYATQKGGTIGALDSMRKNVPAVTGKVLNLTVSGFKIAHKGIQTLTSALWSGASAIYQGAQLHFEDELEAHTN